MANEPAAAGTTQCILEPRPHIWDLGGTMTATFADKSNPGEPVGFINSNQVLEVTLTVNLTGNVLNYLCDTSMCVCLAFEAESGLLPGAADAIADRWHQRAGFSVFFDVRAPGSGRPGERRRRTRLYHEETGDETMLPRLGADGLGEVDARPAQCRAAAVRAGRRGRFGGLHGDHRRPAGRGPGPGRTR